MAMDPTLTNAQSYAKSQGYSDNAFQSWYAKNMGAVAATAGSGGDWGRVESAFKKKAPAPAAPSPRPAPAAPKPAPKPAAAAPPPPVEAPLAGLTAIDVGTTSTQQAPAAPQVEGMGMGMMEPEPPSPTGVESGMIGQLRALGRRSPPIDTYALAGLKKIY